MFTFNELELFDGFINKVYPKIQNCNCNIIIVHHVMATHTPLFDVLTRIFNKVILLPIPYSKNIDTINHLKNKVEVHETGDIDELKETFLTILLREIEQSNEFVIFEVGGYFTDIFKKLPHNELKKKVLGILEDTEAGHRKYESIFKDLSFPIFSIARSPLKSSEDILTGQAIIFSAEKILRQVGWIFSRNQILINGFGKIGKPMALYLRNKGAIVYVYDLDPIRQIEAFSYGFPSKSREYMLENSDIIFGVSGYTSINETDIQKLKKDVILFSGSSRQIEFNVKFLYDTSINSEKVCDGLICLHYQHHPFRLFLANNGMPVNFLDRAIVGDYLKLLWGEAVYILGNLANKSFNNNSCNSINELSKEDRQMIAYSWIDVYCN